MTQYAFESPLLVGLTPLCQIVFRKKLNGFREYFLHIRYYVHCLVVITKCKCAQYVLYVCNYFFTYIYAYMIVIYAQEHFYSMCKG